MVFLHLLIITNYYFMAMKKIKYRLVFNRKGHLSSDGKALIQIEAYLNRRRCLKSEYLYKYYAHACAYDKLHSHPWHWLRHDVGNCNLFQYTASYAQFLHYETTVSMQWDCNFCMQRLQFLYSETRVSLQRKQLILVLFVKKRHLID